ncbi:hypothetical protein AK812_SmicGene17695 [Symbiodinium microadriaticum]|uniref:Uncharacterized protein n=1 Tax=Symbiodinium microadriaticum TaxID=2951 RepID=A0A1Q9DX08_SYMMI|nr:hypothetical protein AK812_SmicGene17695 [Symbiodinium microadriaticum]
MSLETLCLECHLTKTFLDCCLEPLLPPRPRDLRQLASTARPGLQAGQLRSRQGKLADLTFVRIREDRRAPLYRYGKPATAFMLETGLATWADFEWSLDATAHDVFYSMRTSDHEVDGRGCALLMVCMVLGQIFDMLGYLMFNHMRSE